MHRNRTLPPNTLDELRQAFLSALTVSESIFTPHTFQIQVEEGEWRRSQPLFDAVMVAVDRLTDAKDELIRNRAHIVKALQTRLKNKRVYEIVVGKPNTALAVKRRIKILTSILQRYA